ncbi:MAG TPA: hypothetical protein VFC19_41315 [Candidatus Limnocylindrales bacterium]|nr:hypothetical protein [Candidatus Limnocylindrales bacterium]
MLAVVAGLVWLTKGESHPREPDLRQGLEASVSVTDVAKRLQSAGRRFTCKALVFSG